MTRNRWRVGRYLIADDLTGRIVYDDEIVTRYDGVVMRRVGNEDEIARHPQELVRAWKKDPYPVPVVRDRAFPTPDIDFTGSNMVQGVQQPLGAGHHLYPASPGVNDIGQMTIMKPGTTQVSAMACARAFVVRRDP